MKNVNPIEHLKKIVARLRHPKEGCQWDIEQTFSSVSPYTIEEAYEVADAIESNEMSSLKEELGDLLLNIVFHSQIAEESGIFDFNEVVHCITEKLIRRNPHVFNRGALNEKSFQKNDWESHKKKERFEKAKLKGKENPSILDEVASAFPALMRSEKLIKRIEKVGFEWPKTESFFEKTHEKMVEFRIKLEKKSIPSRLVEEEIGDILLNIVKLSVSLNIDPELSLRKSNKKFERRFRLVEDKILASGNSRKKTSLADYDIL